MDDSVWVVAIESGAANASDNIVTVEKNERALVSLITYLLIVFFEIGDLLSNDESRLSVSCNAIVRQRLSGISDMYTLPIGFYTPASVRRLMNAYRGRSRSASPSFPPFDRETAARKARLAEDAWNSRDPEKVATAYTVNSVWRNRSEFSQVVKRSSSFSDANGGIGLSPDQRGVDL